MTKKTKVDLSSGKLIINSPRGIFTEQLQGNLDALTSQGALVRIMKDEKTGGKYVTKLAFRHTGYSHLLNQLSRLQQMNQAKIAIVPQIVDFSVKETYVYYTTSFVEGISGYDNYLRNVRENGEFINKFQSLLENLNKNLWLKGKPTSERKHFTKRHLYVVNRGLQSYQSAIEALPPKRRNIYADSFNLKDLLIGIKDSTKKLDGIMSKSQIPKFSHGDLHLDNILVNKENFITLIDINGSKERKKSIIEFELARLLMSFYREIISSKSFKIISSGGKARVVFTERGEEIIERHKLAYEEILNNQRLTIWFNDKEQSKRIIKIMEALHFVNVFALRPKEEILITYVLGTQLLSQAVKEAELENKKIWN